MLFIEYYPQTVYGQHQEHTIAEKYDLVEFNWHRDKAIEPKWRTLKPPLLDMILKLVQGRVAHIGKTANITVLQIEWEIITGARFLKRQYMAPQKAPATPAAPISIKLNDHM